MSSSKLAPALTERWLIVPLETPPVERHCAGCRATRSFRSSDKFRLNAQQRRLDVWLIYRCQSCSDTWNFSLFHRLTVEEIGGDLYRLMLANDRKTAWRFAFDLERLQRLGVKVDGDLAWRCEGSRQPSSGAARRIVIEMPYAFRLRLDRLLSRVLGVARGYLKRWAADGLVITVPATAAALRRPVRDGQIVEITVDPLLMP